MRWICLRSSSGSGRGFEMPIWSAIKTWLIVASGDALGGLTWTVSSSVLLNRCRVPRASSARHVIGELSQREGPHEDVDWRGRRVVVMAVEEETRLQNLAGTIGPRPQGLRVRQVTVSLPQIRSLLQSLLQHGGFAPACGWT